jgi:hypothetical protein
MPIPFIVNEIGTVVWTRFYRKKNIGPTVTGWPQRLSQFALISEPTPSLAQHLMWLDSITNNALAYTTPHPGEPSKADQSTAMSVLHWGGVTRGNSPKVPNILEQVVETARSGNDIYNAPMNSGWTKIAAIYAYPHKSAPPQIIWDSRVSLSICCRLANYGVINKVNKTQLCNLFPNLGWVPGRGGNRPKLISHAASFFPNRYGSWKAHFAGGQIAKDISDYLNKHMTKYGSPSSALSQEEITILKANKITVPTKWDPWLVACVLFMDGQ